MSMVTASAKRAELSSVLVKAAMAVSGLGMALWLTLHMLGNLLWLLGPGAMDRYGEALHGSGVLWPVRLLLVTGFAVHVVAALLTTRRGHAARPTRYRITRHRTSALASRSMRWTGLLLLGFIGYHVASVYGVGRPASAANSFYQNLSELLSRPWDALALGAAAGLIALHLGHGLASAFMSLGLISRRHEHWLRRSLHLWAYTVTIGFSAPPLLFWLSAQYG